MMPASSAAATAAGQDPDATPRALAARLDRLESANAIRACVTRYMDLCDRLDAATPLDALLDCFTEDAVWAGKGARYGAAFGGHRGRAAIGDLFRAYMGTPPHFALNVHFLASEHIAVSDTDPDRATAGWVMWQASTYADGRSQLNAARLALAMARDPADGRWRIARFETENLFGRPVDAWRGAQPLPVPPPVAASNAS